MNLNFEQIFKNEDNKVAEVYEILRVSGKHMYNEQGLIHWKNPYPIESIKKKCEEAEVFLVKETDTDSYVHTFQLEFTRESNRQINNKSSNEVQVAVISKFATIPSVAGKGIGKLSMDFIEEYCHSKGVSKICLDVYDKSNHAIKFYENRGFIVMGSKPTRHFTVTLMEKQI